MWGALDSAWHGEALDNRFDYDYPCSGIVWYAQLDWSLDMVVITFLLLLQIYRKHLLKGQESWYQKEFVFSQSPWWPTLYIYIFYICLVSNCDRKHVEEIWLMSFSIWQLSTIISTDNIDGISAFSVVNELRWVKWFLVLKVVLTIDIFAALDISILLEII